MATPPCKSGSALDVESARRLVTPAEAATLTSCGIVDGSGGACQPQARRARVATTGPASGEGAERQEFKAEGEMHSRPIKAKSKSLATVVTQDMLKPTRRIGADSIVMQSTFATVRLRPLVYGTGTAWVLILLLSYDKNTINVAMHM